MPIFFGVDVGARLQIIDAGAAGGLVVVAQMHVAEADRLAGARPVHDQHRDAALDQVGHAAQELDLLGDVEPVEEHHARAAPAFRVLRRDEVAGQALALERHLDHLDLRDRSERRTDGSNRRRCGRRRAPERPWACGSARPSDSSGRRADRTRRPRPGVSLARNLSACPRTSSATRMKASNHAASSSARLSCSMRPILCSSLISVPPIGGASQHVDEGRRPAIVAGKIHEVFGR